MLKTAPQIAAIALLWAASALAAGCGDSDQSHAKSSRATAEGSTVAEFVDAVMAIHETTVAARTPYFQGSSERAHLIAAVRGAQVAYAKAGRRMASLRAPAEATRVQRELAAVYSTTADKLARVLARRPFNRSRADTIMVAAHEQGDMLYGDVFTIPQ